MCEICLGKPSQKIIDQCKAHYPPAPTETPYVYAGTDGGVHEHKFEVTSLTGEVDWDEGGQIGTQTCKVNGETINNADIIYLSANSGCKCTSIGSKAFPGGLPLASVSLPTATSIESGAFDICDSLISLELDSITQAEVEAKAYDTWFCQTDIPITVKCILTATGKVGTFVLQVS